uniref:Uncharacterized protein n=1 Tax=Meloidogyne incognita TaxID=6306 RepID=A0A914MDW4_MELIC
MLVRASRLINGLITVLRRLKINDKIILNVSKSAYISPHHQFVESLKQFLHDTRKFPCCRLRLLLLRIAAVVCWRRHCSLVLSMTGVVRGK